MWPNLNRKWSKNLLLRIRVERISNCWLISETRTMRMNNTLCSFLNWALGRKTIYKTYNTMLKMEFLRINSLKIGIKSSPVRTWILFSRWFILNHFHARFKRFLLTIFPYIDFIHFVFIFLILFTYFQLIKATLKTFHLTPPYTPCHPYIHINIFLSDCHFILGIRGLGCKRHEWKKFFFIWFPLLISKAIRLWKV